jgi:acetylornithine deacetylase/succinyl-diaminopimelate desuccinylase-like protein
VTGLELLRQLLRINTTNPPGSEEEAAQALEARLSSGGLKCEILRSPEGRANLVARLEGPTDRPALVLLSHTDVVGVEPDRWSRDPFGAEIEDGCVWGRGALDMKGIAVMHAEAACALASSGSGPSREVVVCAVADEEVGGAQGAEWLLSEHPDAVGFGDGRPPPEVLGEGAYGLGGVLDVPLMPVALGEKSSLWLDLRAEGEPGHASLPPPRQAALNLARFLSDSAGFGPPRLHPVMREQFATLASATSGVQGAAFRVLASRAGGTLVKAIAPQLRRRGPIGALLSDTVSLTILDAGYKHNVIPGEATAALDCRLLPDTDPDDFLAHLRRKADRFGVELSPRPSMRSPVSDRGALWSRLVEASRALDRDCVVVPTISPAMTDVRFFRQRGATGYGWVPLIASLDLLTTIHGHDERVPVEAFERAVELTAEVVRTASS